MSERAWRVVLIGLALLNLAQAAWLVVDKPSFAAGLVPFGAFNAHLLDDYAAAAATFGLALVGAALHPPWRVPLLAVTTVWTALHAISHLAAMGDATKPAVGVVEALGLAVFTAMFALLSRRAAAQDREDAPGRTRGRADASQPPEGAGR